MHYIPNSKDAEKEILAAIGVESFEDLIDNIPEKFLKKYRISLPEPLSELETVKKLSGMAGKNSDTESSISYLGAGSYDHFIPAAVDFLISRSEFYTAYTPYQPEVAQGTLQSIYEYQSMICHLMDMEVANASLYDGATALAEAAIMAVNKTRRNKVLVSDLININSRKVLDTYLETREVEIQYIPESDGVTKLDSLNDYLDDQVAALLIQSPNFFGNIEDLKGIADQLHANRSLLIMSVNPVAAALLKTPGECDADIAVAEGQPLGIHQAFGGPYLGIFSSKKDLIRSMPGRIVGKTADIDGKPGYVLVLQTREQHIRREKATSNICTNQGLMALAAAIYLALMGKNGLRQVARLSLDNAHYLAEKIDTLPGYSLAYPDRPFFNEFMIHTPVSAEKIVEMGLENNIFAGLDMGRFSREWDHRLLIAVTEKRNQQEMDDFINFLSKFRKV
ncbi:MAG: aminomethyl-transferring glycine dehydrogenase subunit GcvPA [Candidatus Neomarinimicrobiota bacterium]|nr:MAG: aminomethyl-transferring glycine dehydrogenase subunit GcvPA [Candidatus Neomarinimicrobiota bacterium]